VLDLATQIADGLAAAHEVAIVHRDLKPENIMVTRSGRAKILDFGLTRPVGFHQQADLAASSDHETETELGLRSGTVPYMSPEQARGSPTDFHSDQFSFGLILYEMATGRPAFRRETPAATLHAIINDELPAALHTLPLQLRWIIDRCLAKDVSDRYASTTDLHRELRTLRDRLPEAIARDATVSPHARIRTWRVLLIGGAVVASLATGAFLTAAAFQRWMADRPVLRFTPLATEPGYEGFPAWSPGGQTIAYAAEVEGVLQIFTRPVSSSVSSRVTNAAYDCKHPFWSRDGQRIYYVSLARDRDSIWSVGAAGGTPQVVVQDAIRSAISPDGRTLAFLRDEQRVDILGTQTLWLSTPVGSEPRKYDGFGAPGFIEGALAFSPDGTKLGVCAVPGMPGDRVWQFWIVPLDGRPPYRRLQNWSEPGPQVTSFSWLPDSRHVVLGISSLSTPGFHLWMADLERDQAWPVTRSPDSESYPSSSPAGDRIAFSKGDPDYDLVDLSLSGQTMRPLLATARNESEAVWSPDGNFFAYVTDRTGQDEIWIRSREGQWLDRPLITQREFGDNRTLMLGSPAFSPDGQQIAYQRNGLKPRWPLRIWISRTAGGPPVPLLPRTHEGFQGAPTWSPDGQWIAYGEWKDRAWVLARVRVGSDEEPVVLRTDGVPNAAPQWSPRNDWITWETKDGFLLVSPDGRNQRLISEDQWLVHTWSRDGLEVFGVRETEDLRLSLVAVDPRTRRTRVIADVGPSLPVNNPVKGLSITADGRTITTSVLRLRGDLWLLDGLNWHDSFWRWLWPAADR
jgi:eukaryotic-like serine/threonine-protein kinase